MVVPELAYAFRANEAALIAMTRGEELFAPRSLPWEIVNAFSAMFKRKAGWARWRG